MALDPRQQAQLYAAKLRSLARDGLSIDIVDPEGLAAGAIGQSADGEHFVYLVEESPQRSLGRALAAGVDRGASHFHLLCAAGAGVIARRASEFDLDVSVWSTSGDAVERVSPETHVGADQPAATVLGLAADIAAAGADPVVEHGTLIGEVRGLEIVRAEEVDGTPELRVGVGDFDREAFRLLHGSEPTMDAVRAVVSMVADHRRPGAEIHPLNRVASERWLRSLLVDSPSRIGFDSLVGAEPPVERVSIKAPTPAVAVGTRDGTESVVVVSTGIDLELVPYAADARLRIAPDAPLVLVVPNRDAHPITRRLAAALRSPADVVTVADDWRSWPPHAPA